MRKRFRWRAARGTAAVVLLGALIESLALSAGAYGYAGGWPVWWLPPWWVLALWALLGMIIGALPAPLRSRPWLSAVCGGLLGPLGFVVLVRLGAARFIVPPAVGLAFVGILWAFVLPLAFAVRRAAGGGRV